MEQHRPPSPATAPHLHRGGAGIPQPPLRRHTRSSSSSSSSLSSSSTAAASYSPPLPNSSSSAIPFSWEFRPGVPKNPSAAASRSSDRELLLPAPPPLRIRSSAAAALKKPDRDPAPAPPQDPFAAAFAECSMDSPDAAAFARRREIIRPAAAVSGGIMLYWLRASSCKTSVAVSDSTTVRAARSAIQDRRRRRFR